MLKRTEYDEQRAIVHYLRYKYPECLFTSDLGGVKLNKGLAVKMAKIRPFRGHPDLTVYESRLGFHSLFLELKLPDVKLKYKEENMGPRGSLDTHQVEQYQYMQKLEKRGFACSFALGFEHAKALLDAYLKEDLEAFSKAKTL